jgi:hypothetical protein
MEYLNSNHPGDEYFIAEFILVRLLELRIFLGSCVQELHHKCMS